MPQDSTPFGDFDVVKDIKERVKPLTRSYKPLGLTEINHQFIDSLDRPSDRADDGTRMTLLEQVPAPRDDYAAVLDGIHDPRLAKVLKRFDSEQLRVVLAFADGAGEKENWPQTAEAADVSREFAESVRRKLLREAKEVQRRIAATTATGV